MLKCDDIDMSCQLLVTTQCERAMNSLIAVYSYENSAHTQTQHHGTLARNMCVNCWCVCEFVFVCVCVRKKVSFYQQRKWKHDPYITQCLELFTFFLTFFAVLGMR